MAEINITNVEAGRAACDTLKSGIQKIEVAYQTSSSGFNTLTQADPDLGSHFISELAQSLTDIYNFLSNNVYPAADAYYQPDNITEEAENPTPVPGPGDSGIVDDGGGHNGGTKIKVTTPPTDSPPETTETPTEAISEVPVVPQLEVPLDDLTLTEIDGAIESLISMAEEEDKYLDEHVEDDKNSDKIKEMLLNSPYLPQDFKDMIKDMDSKAVRAYIEGLLKGEYPEVFELHSMNLGILYIY
jgi:hypothetical protein